MVPIEERTPEEPGEPSPEAVQRAASPSSAQVERLYREHNESLVRFLRARLHSDADAREAAQEAYVRLLGLDDPEHPSFLRAYLFRVAANVATDYLRRRAVVRRNADPADEREVHAATQERQLAAKQDLQLIDRAIGELPPRCRAAFIMIRFDGCRPAEVASRLGVSERMVRLYHARALEHLQHAVDAGGAGERRR
jgi:RNA polymerase sigma-70 factor (ECF subfamily)